MKLEKIYIKECIVMITLVTLLSSVLIAAAAPTGAISDDGKLVYQQLSSGEYQVTSSLTQSEKIYIPDTYKGKEVRAIAAEAFEDVDNISEVVFGENIQFVGKNTFKNCTTLKRILVPTNTSTYFTKDVLNTTLQGNNQTITLYEKDAINYYVDGVAIESNMQQDAIYYTERGVNETIEFTLSILENPTAIWDGSSWKAATELAPIDISSKSTIYWYKEDIERHRSKIGSGSQIIIENLRADSAGLYYAELSGKRVLQIQLDMQNDSISSKKENGVSTGFHQGSIVLLLVGSLCILSGIWIYRKKRRL